MKVISDAGTTEALMSSAFSHLHSSDASVVCTLTDARKEVTLLSIVFTTRDRLTMLFLSAHALHEIQQAKNLAIAYIVSKILDRTFLLCLHGVKFTVHNHAQCQMSAVLNYVDVPLSLLASSGCGANGISSSVSELGSFKVIAVHCHVFPSLCIK